MRQLAAPGLWVQKIQSHGWMEAGLGDINPVTDHAWDAPCMQQGEGHPGERVCWRWTDQPPMGAGVRWLQGRYGLQATFTLKKGDYLFCEASGLCLFFILNLRQEDLLVAIGTEKAMSWGVGGIPFP